MRGGHTERHRRRCTFWRWAAAANRRRKKIWTDERATWTMRRHPVNVEFGTLACRWSDFRVSFLSAQPKFHSNVPHFGSRLNPSIAIYMKLFMFMRAFVRAARRSTPNTHTHTRSHAFHSNPDIHNICLFTLTRTYLQLQRFEIGSNAWIGCYCFRLNQNQSIISNKRLSETIVCWSPANRMIYGWRWILLGCWGLEEPEGTIATFCCDFWIPVNVLCCLCLRVWDTVHAPTDDML